jgi:hypothetical protein
VDSVTRKKFQKTMAYHYFVTGTSFQRIEDSLLGDAIRILRPDDGLLPNRQKLGGDLLEECYRELSKKDNMYLTTVSAGICLITDGWSNVRNEPIASQMIIRIRIPPFRLIQIEFFTLNAEASLQINRQFVFMVL